MEEETNATLVQTVNALVQEVERLRLKISQLENAQKILRTEAMRIKTMSDKYLPSIGDMMGHNGRKGA
jgi:hypothetical protein